MVPPLSQILWESVNKSFLKPLILLYKFLMLIFKFINFSFQIFLLFVPEMSTSFMSYIVKIICVASVWIL